VKDMRSALTLIELVVVGAIIVVLVGIVWVLMAPSREKARQAVCISNLPRLVTPFECIGMIGME
jgi:Tfp pilus assembly protein PilE